MHGDYISLEKKLKKFRKKYMNHWSIDLGEFSEKNWIFNAISCDLCEIVKKNNVVFVKK